MLQNLTRSILLSRFCSSKIIIIICINNFITSSFSLFFVCAAHERNYLKNLYKLLYILPIVKMTKVEVNHKPIGRHICVGYLSEQSLRPDCILLFLLNDHSHIRSAYYETLKNLDSCCSLFNKVLYIKFSISPVIVLF